MLAGYDVSEAARSCCTTLRDSSTLCSNVCCAFVEALASAGRVVDGSWHNGGRFRLREAPDAAVEMTSLPEVQDMQCQPSRRTPAASDPMLPLEALPLTPAVSAIQPAGSQAGWRHCAGNLMCAGDGAISRRAELELPTPRRAT